MPFAPPRPCTRGKRCPHLVTRAKPCPVHGGGKPEHPWDADDRRQAPARIRGRTLQTLRRLLFAREPLCRLCVAAGRATIATVRDHIVNLVEGGQDTDDNVQPICDDCHKAKTHAESMRRRRAR